MNFSRLSIELNQDLVWRLFFVFCGICIILGACDAAFAAPSANNDVVGTTLCRLTANLTGGTAKGLATIAIFAIGVGTFMGKFQWSTAALVAAGVGVIFAAPNLVAFISGDAANSNCPTS